MKTPAEILAGIHDQILQLRSIELIVSKNYFDRYWKDSTSRQKKELLKFIKEGNRCGVFDWIKNHPSIDLAEMGIHVLRRLAQSAKIPNWSRMCKTVLILALQKRKE